MLFLTFSMQRTTLFLCLFLLLSVCNSAIAQHTKHLTAPGPTPIPSAPVAAPDKAKAPTEWSFLPLSATHADEFVRDHPTYDGRGVIIYVFDTGVDPGVTGLLTTSEGTRKVIDVRDYSGTGDVLYVPAEREGDELRVNGETVLHGLNGLGIHPVDGKYYYGSLNELRYQNGLHDLNFDGNDTDVFGILIYEDSDGHYAAFVDSDGDHDLSDEHKVTNYHEHYDTFMFHTLDTAQSQDRKLTGAVNIYPESHIVSVYFDDGSHGTHVAGIASGYDIDNEPGFNGVAPGAQLIAVKFADNNAGGVTVTGSMQRAFEDAAAMADSQSKPVVINMSFGIGNELEGHAAMDVWLDSLLAATPNLTVCVAGGNEGPGLSSIGLPGSASRVIASAAGLPVDAAHDLYRLYTTHPLIFDFSSRGGELAKPDIVSPGTAVSTVPDYVESDRYNGTSMASPYTAGCAALLLSAMRQAFPSWKPDAFEIKRAMELSADHIENATPLDEGYGMIDVPKAFELLSHWEHHNEIPVPATIEATIPTITDIGTSAYFRAGNYPTEGDHESFTVELGEPSNASARQRVLGMEAFDLVSDAAWMSPVESSIYRRGSGAMDVDVRYHSKLLATPGLYSGRIWAYPKGMAHTRDNAAFDLVNSIAVPYTFSDANKYRVDIPTVSLDAGMLEREFFAIPPGTKSVTITLSARDMKSGCEAYLFDNEGQEFSRMAISEGATKRSSSLFIGGTEVTPGVWELDLSRTMSSEDEPSMPLEVAVQVQPLDVENVSTGLTSSGAPTVRAEISNPSLLDYSAQASGELAGYEHVIDTLISSSDEFSLPFTSRAGERGVIFYVSMPKEDYDLVTDVACQVLKPDSSAVFNSAFDYADKTVPVFFGDDSSGTNYRLFIRPALALPDHAHEWHLRIVEDRYFQHGVYLSGSPAQVTLPPYQSRLVRLSSDNAAPVVPNGYHLFGTINLGATKDQIVRIPVRW